MLCQPLRYVLPYLKHDLVDQVFSWRDSPDREFPLGEKAMGGQLEVV